MRTTLDLPDEMLRKAKIAAVERRSTLRQLVIEALRREMESPLENFNVVRREPSPALRTDAWLAALAQAGDCEMVTFDRGFRLFSRLTLRLLVP